MQFAYVNFRKENLKQTLFTAAQLVAHTSNPCTQEAEGQTSEFKVQSQPGQESKSKTAGATQRKKGPVSKNNSKIVNI